MKKHLKGTRWYLYPFMILLAAVAVLPLIVLFQLAFLPTSEITSGGIWQISYTLENVKEAWTSAGLGRAASNSFLLTIFSLAGTVTISCSAAYIIARFRTWATDLVYDIFIFSMAIPTIISTVPLYIIMRRIHAVNTLWGMVLLCITASLPFAIFLYTGTIRNISRDMEEAAIIDGCNNCNVLWRILFPVLKPTTLTVVLLNMVFYWNEYGRSVFFLQKRRVYTVPLAISTFAQQYSTQWGLVAGGAFLAMIPAVIVFLSFQKYYIKGIASGASKG
ncbi:MAG: carbohydrate ABC transporter permease [Faecalibacterium sp.]|nr:carbohydrate ABC transporter permease [Faecalibacterium sp.]